MEIRLSLFLILLYLSSYAQQNPAAKNFKANLEKYQNVEAQHGHYLQTARTSMHYLTWGNPTNRAFIWIHGSLGSAYELEPFAADLCKLGVFFIAIDYYGHGQTALPAYAATQGDIADDIALLMDSLQLESAIIGGFSRGAYIAGEFYAKYPEKTKALILEDGGIAPFKHQYRNLPDSILRKKIKAEIAAQPPILFQSYPTKEKAYEALVAFDGEETKDTYKSLALIRKTGPQNYSIYQGLDSLFGMDTEENYYQMLNNPTRVNSFARSMVNYRPENIFAKIQVPILALQAQSVDDPLPDEDYYRKLEASSALVKHRIFHDVAHAIHYEQPKLFFESLTSFIQENK